MTTTLLFVRDESDLDLARDLVDHGHRVALAGADLASLFRCAGATRRIPAMIVGDPDDRRDHDRVVARAVAMLGPLDAVVGAPADMHSGAASPVAA